MTRLPRLFRSTGFAVLMGLCVAWLAQTLIEVLTPVSVFDGFRDDGRDGHVVLIAGVTSFWREDALIRLVASGLGALAACLCARSQRWPLLAALVAGSVIATAFAQMPRPVLPWQLAVWASAGPAGALVVGLVCRRWKGSA